MFKRLEEGMNWLIEITSMSLLVLMTLIVSWVVFSRYFLHYTPAWGEESALLCMVWFGFLSIAIGVRDELHLDISLIDMVLPSGMKKLLYWFKQILLLAFACFMVREGLTITQVGAGNYMPGIKLSSSVLYAAVPVAGIFMVFYVISNSLKQLRSNKNREVRE